MSEIGLGLAALGRPAYINLGHADDLGEDRSPDGLRAQTHTVLDHAYAAGVRYFDAARSYGLAEEFLGGWLRERDPDGVFIASKWGYTYTAGWRIDVEDHEIKDLTAGQLRRQLAETREHLGSWLRLYQIHSATIESGVLEDAEVLGELAALRETGVQIGLTATGTRQSDTIDASIATGAFDAVQATWNLHERTAGDALARANAAGMRVIVKEAVANGRLTDRAAPPALAAVGARARGGRRCRRAGRRARTAVVRRRPQRRVDGRDARQQPRGPGHRPRPGRARRARGARRPLLGDPLSAQLELGSRSIPSEKRRSTSFSGSSGSCSWPSAKLPFSSRSDSGPWRMPRAKSGSSCSSGVSGLWSAPSSKPDSTCSGLAGRSCGGMRSSAMSMAYPVSSAATRGGVA